MPTCPELRNNRLPSGKYKAYTFACNPIATVIAKYNWSRAERSFKSGNVVDLTICSVICGRDLHAIRAMYSFDRI